MCIEYMCFYVPIQIVLYMSIIYTYVYIVVYMCEIYEYYIEICVSLQLLDIYSHKDIGIVINMGLPS